MKNPLGPLAALVLLGAACTSQPAREALACGSPGDAAAPADVTLTAHDAVIDARSRAFVAWTYDGDVPGPVLRLNVGDTRRVKLVNDSPRPASLHFHGVEYGAPDDGTAGESMVNPGCAHVYTIRATEAGVWAYHSHHDPRAEMARGLHGAVVVPSPGEAPADREYVMFMGQLGIEGEAAEAGEEGEESGATAPFFAMTLNGRPDGAAEVIAWDPTTQQYARQRDVHFTAKVGDLVRWRVVNVSPDDAHTFHLHGHRWCDRNGGLPDAQGSCPTGSLPTDNVDLLPAQGLSLEYREDNPGEWMVHCHVVDHVTDGMFAFYDVSP